MIETQIGIGQQSLGSFPTGLVDELGKGRALGSESTLQRLRVHSEV